MSITSYHYSRAGWMFLWAVLTLMFVGNGVSEEEGDSSTSSRLLQSDDENASCNEEDGTGCEINLPAWLVNYKPSYKRYYIINFVFLVF
jgi:hypothetical protein